MRIKTSELTGAPLNWAVAKIIGLDIELRYGVVHVDDEPFMPDLDWAVAGPIIERESITVGPNPFGPAFAANLSDLDTYGPTPLIAAMRCYVASQLGGEVEIPKELLT
jgi:hypothetical protein